MADDIKEDNQKSVDIPRNYFQEELYKKNVELHFANDILSLTHELYSISLLSLPPMALTERMTSSIREKLELEAIGVLIYKQKEDILEPLSFSKSDRLTSSMRKLNLRLRDVSINDASKKPIFKSIFEGQIWVSKDLGDIWGGILDNEKLTKIKEEANIKTIIAYPLLTEDRIIGVLVFGLHLDNENIPPLEKDAFKTFSDIIAIALDKSYMNKKLDEVNQSLVSANLELLKANEELKTIDETKSSILSNASHHLQNPLQNIVMGASMLLDGSFGVISPEAKKAVASMFESARHLTITFKMWVKTLDFENDKVEYKMEHFDLGQLIEKTIIEWRVSAKERGLELTLENDNNAPYTILGDKEWIREVVVNLVDNALKMTEKGNVKIRLEKVGTEKVKMTVADTGVGITPETMKNLFQKFGKGQESWKKDVYGTGLGLFISKKIIEDGHHGKISAESGGKDKGAKFTVEFPINV